ncbi:hypothetical protein EON70_00390 [bacterium]|nr:MAG: hypothetical protein EON70_00390 [bacterium]
MQKRSCAKTRLCKNKVVQKQSCAKTLLCKNEVFATQRNATQCMVRYYQNKVLVQQLLLYNIFF